MLSFNELKKVDLGVLFKSLMSNRTTLIKGPFAKVILWSVLGFLVFFAYVFFIFWPSLEHRQEMQKKVDAIPEMETRLKFLDVANRKAEDDLFQAERNYAELNQLFSVESELEELYQRLSYMASSQGLVISSLTKEGEDAIYPGAKQVAGGQTPPQGGNVPAADGKEANKAAAPLFYRIRLKIELTGQYTRYMRYRKQLAEFDKSINIDKEQITLVPGDSRGTVVVKSQLSTFRLPNKLPARPGLPPKASEVLLPPSAQSVSFIDDQEMRYIKVGGLAAADPLSGPAGTFSDIQPSAKPGSNSTANSTSGRAEENLLANPASNETRKAPKAQDRDPFARSSSGMIEGGRDPRMSPLLMANPESYMITGVIVSSSVKAAMIRTDFRENYVVKIGDRLGNQGGVIVDIDMDGIVLKQGSGRIRLYVQSQTGQQPGAPNPGAGRAQ
jgi:Tfp pilus assembly protein PilO